MSVPLVKIENIPEELKKIPNWVCYRTKAVKKADGTTKNTKIPINTNTGRLAKTSDSKTWAAYDLALQFLLDPTNDSVGLGFVFQHTNNIFALDLDHCVDSKGTVHPEAQEIIDAFNTYTELSPSGDGLHIFGIGTLQSVTSKKYRGVYPFEVEIFCDSYFMTITGDTPTSGGAKLMKCGTQLKELFRRIERQKLTNAKDTLKKSIKTEKDNLAGNPDSPYYSSTTFEAQIIPLIKTYSPRDKKSVTGRTSAGWTWTIDCPWQTEHRSGSNNANVFCYSDGVPAFNCFHTACEGRGWKDLARLTGVPEAHPIDQYNQHHAVIRIDGKVMVLNEEAPENGGNRVSFSSFQDFKSFYQNDVKLLEIEGSKIKLPLANIWLESDTRRQYNGMMFEPSPPPRATAYNLFKGFETEHIEGDWGLMREHVLNNVCLGDLNHFHYLMCWTARIMQDPGGKKPGTTPVLSGGQGTGKSIFGTALTQVFAPHSAHLTMSNHLTGNFNSHLQDKVFVFADEAFFAGDKSALGRLKGLITESKITIEPKGVNAFEVSNHISLVMASNESWVVPADLTDRRFFVLNVGNGRAKDTTYFTAIQRQMENGGYEALAYDLMNWNIDIDLRMAPLTAGLLAQKEATLGSVERYIDQCVHDGELLRGSRGPSGLEDLVDGEPWPVDATRADIYRGYLLFCRGQNIRYPESVSWFWRKLYGALDMRWENETMAGGGQSARGVKIPPLQEVTDAWELKKNGSGHSAQGTPKTPIS